MPVCCYRMLFVTKNAVRDVNTLEMAVERAMY
jgi:hypothetical protein